MSEELILDQEPGDKSTEPSKRPVMLSVLCVLTWIGSAITIWLTLPVATGNPLTHSAGIVLAACNIATAIGAILMWKLRRTGYYIYLAGEIVPVIITILVYLDFSDQRLGILMFLKDIIMVMVVPITFILLYSRFLKIFR